MIFASDLDQTLIFSRNSMGEIGEEELVPVERDNGEIRSFMTREAYRLLRELDGRVLFVPTTTRIFRQYDRVFGLAEAVGYRYAIVSNGGRVLVDGVADAEWDERVRGDVRRESASSEEVKALFDGLARSEWILKESYCDDLFYSIIVRRDEIPDGWMGELAGSLDGLGWNASLQGRKIYLVPNSVSKGSAVRYVAELAGDKEICAAGDSLLDESMLLGAGLAMAPAHGELFRKYGGSHDRIRFAGRSGIRAAEDILEAVTNRLQTRSAL